MTDSPECSERIRTEIAIADYLACLRCCTYDIPRAVKQMTTPTLEVMCAPMASLRGRPGAVGYITEQLFAELARRKEE